MKPNIITVNATDLAATDPHLAKLLASLSEGQRLLELVGIARATRQPTDQPLTAEETAALDDGERKVQEGMEMLASQIADYVFQRHILPTLKDTDAGHGPATTH